jgi:DnaJ-class molecular chaperone
MKTKINCAKCNGSGMSLPFGGSGVECKECQGTGHIDLNQEYLCPICKGTGINAWEEPCSCKTCLNNE